MPYTKTNWQDRVVQRPLTYAQTINQDGTITLTPAPGTVTQAGTPVNSANLNKIEQGVETAQFAIETHSIDYSKHGVNGNTTGSANNYVLTPTPALAAYTTFLRITVIFHVTNTGASTINISGLGPKALKKVDGSDFYNLELNVDTPYTFAYNGLAFIAQGERGVAVPGFASKGDFWLQGPQLPSFYPRYRHGMAAVGNKAYLFGGRSTITSADTGNTCLELDLTNGTSWVQKTNIPTPRLDSNISAMCTTVGTNVYVMGGNQGTTKVNEMFNSTANSWVTKANMPMISTESSKKNSVAIGTQIYLVGDDTIKTYQYNTTTDTWTTKADKPTLTNNSFSAVVGDKVYVFGGNAGMTYYRKCEIYNSTTNVWTTATAQMPFDLYRAVAFSIGTKIIISQGYNGASSSLPNFSVLSYDTITDTYTTKKQLPLPNGELTAGCITDSNNIVVTGGRTSLSGGADNGSSVTSYLYTTSIYTP